MDIVCKYVERIREEEEPEEEIYSIFPSLLPYSKKCEKIRNHCKDEIPDKCTQCCIIRDENTDNREESCIETKCGISSEVHILDFRLENKRRLLIFDILEHPLYEISRRFSSYCSLEMETIFPFYEIMIHVGSTEACPETISPLRIKTMPK